MRGFYRWRSAKAVGGAVAWMALLLLAAAAGPALGQWPDQAGALDALRNGAAAQRHQAIRWLAEHGSQAAVDPLVAVLQGEQAAAAKLAEAALWQIWSRSGDEQTDRLLAQGTLLLSQGAAQESIRYFDAVIQRTPEFAEGYNKRATAWYEIGAYERSLADIDRTLAHNPQHFGALSGAGLCLIGLNRLDAAIGWFDRALRVNPTMDGIRKLRDAVAARVRKRI